MSTAVLHPPSDLKARPGDLRNGLLKITKHLQPEHRLNIFRITNRFNIGKQPLCTHSVEEIAKFLESEPGADYLAEIDPVTKDGGKVRWGVCFYSEVKNYHSDLEYRGRLLSLLTILDCQVSGASHGMTPLHIRGREGIYSLYLTSRFTKASLPVASLAMNRLCECAEEALSLLTPGYYSISPTEAFALPLNPDDYGIQKADLIAPLEVAA